MSARLILCFSAAAWLVAVSISSAAEALSAAAKQKVVGAAATALREAYIYPEKGDRTASLIEKKLSEGVYERQTSPACQPALDLDP